MQWLRGSLGCALLLLATLSPAHAQTDKYPDRVIRVIVGFAAGGGNDLFARLVMQKFEQNTGAKVVIENRVGAGGRLAAEYVANQAADGYTIMVAVSGAKKERDSRLRGNERRELTGVIAKRPAAPRRRIRRSPG